MHSVAVIFAIPFIPLSPGEGQQLLQDLRNNVNAARRQLKTAEAMVSMASAELRQIRIPDGERLRKEA